MRNTCRLLSASHTRPRSLASASVRPLNCRAQPVRVSKQSHTVSTRHVHSSQHCTSTLTTDVHVRFTGGTSQSCAHTQVDLCYILNLSLLLPPQPSDHAILPQPCPGNTATHYHTRTRHITPLHRFLVAPLPDLPSSTCVCLPPAASSSSVFPYLSHQAPSPYQQMIPTAGVTITFADEQVGSFHLSHLYPSNTPITADSSINDIQTTLAAFVSNVVPSTVFLTYSDPSHTCLLSTSTVLGGTAVLYVGVVHPYLSAAVAGLSERRERRLLELVERTDATIVDVVHRGQDRLAIAAAKAEELADDAAAQAALVRLLEARVYGLDKLAGSDQPSSVLQTADDAVAAAVVTATAQVRVTADLQSDITEVQTLLAHILRDVAEVAVIVDQAETELEHGRRHHARGGTEAAKEQIELSEARLIVHALTEVLELGSEGGGGGSGHIEGR